MEISGQLQTVKIISSESKNNKEGYIPAYSHDNDYNTAYVMNFNGGNGNFLMLTLEEEVAIYEVKVVNIVYDYGSDPAGTQKRIAGTKVMVYSDETEVKLCGVIEGRI